MLDFLIPKSKIQAYGLREVPIETFEIIGIDQVNPYCSFEYENDIFLTVVNFAFESRKFDEKEGLIVAQYFTVKRCPKCKQKELIPTKIKLNFDSTYLKHEEEIAFDAYEEFPSRRHFPSTVQAYCRNCSACFEMKIKSKDCWVKEAKKIKEYDLITKSWEEYDVD